MTLHVYCKLTTTKQLSHRISNVSMFRTQEDKTGHSIEK